MQERRQILEAMHGHIDFSREQRFLQFLGEQTLDALLLTELGERGLGEPVSGRLDDPNLARARSRAAQARAHPTRLG